MLCTSLCLVPVLGEHHISLINKSTVIAPPSIVLLVHLRVVLPLLVCPHACANQLLRLYRVPQPRRKKPSWEKEQLGWRPDNRCNSNARIRMECVIVPSWPLPGTSIQVNSTTLANSDFSSSGGNCCQSSTGTAVPCRSCGPAVGDGTTRSGLVGHDATLASTLRCDPWSRLCH